MAAGDRLLLVLIAVHVAVAILLGTFTGFAFNPQMPGLLAMLLGILMPWFVLIRFGTLVYDVGVRQRSQRPLADVVGTLKSLAMDFRWQIESVLRFLAITLFIASASYLKEMITVIQPFAWDAFYAQMDRWLHFGIDPWRLLMPLTGSHSITWALNMVYHGWFFAIYFCVFVACFARNATSKAFLLAFVLTFAIGGNVLATVFSSAGPVYYEALGLGDDFAPLMSHLYMIDETWSLPALAVQEGLWASYETNNGHAAISAVPSMHVATSVLMALFAFAMSRFWGWVMTLFAVMIMLGSVQLGWHYAVDGYMGALIAWVAWWASRRMVPEH